jgi:hypothetical protein
MSATGGPGGAAEVETDTDALQLLPCKELAMATQEHAFSYAEHGVQWQASMRTASET